MGSERKGAQIVIAPGMDESLVRQIFSKKRPEAFCSMCQIVREDETTGFLEPTPAQIQVIRAIEANAWTFVTKYRQAKITTVVILHLLLRDCMYLQGVEGVLIADTNDTAEMAFRRIRYAYENLPPEVKMPLVSGSKGSKRELEFIHGGRIVIKSLESRSPAVGHSIDRLHITELGEAVHQRRAIVNLFPGINKRPNAKLVIESTPGKAGTYHERMWHEALRGEGRFHPVFLDWWRDATCQIDPTGINFTEEELEYMAKCSGMTHRALAFRRQRLSSEFVGDTRLYDSKYPPDAVSGWLGSSRPRMPEMALREQYLSSADDPDVGSYGVGEFEPPIPGRKYEIYADPCGFGSTKGDPAALTIFDLETMEEVAVWSDREDPDRFAVRISLAAERYNNARAVVESNHAGCITALRTLNVRLVYSKRHPGWWATDVRIAKAEFALIALLRDSAIRIRSRKGISQLRVYDGNFKKRIKDEDDVGHHFDRARTYIMAGEYLTKVQRRTDKLAAQSESEAKARAEAEEGLEERVPGTIPFSMLNSERRKSTDRVAVLSKPLKHR